MFGVRLSKMGSASKLGLIAKAIGILRSYGADAHIYLPGVGTLSGITAGNYLDSAGTTAATVDNPVGLSLDALQAMTLGSELVTNPTINSIAIGGPAFTYYAPGGSVISGKKYKVSYTVSAYSGSDTIGTSNFSGAPELSGNGNVSFILDAASTASLSFYTRSSNQCTFTNISVREIPGIHATQATTANKPILRRGLLNQLLWSGDFANADWQKASTTLGAYTADPNGGTSATIAAFAYGGTLRQNSIAWTAGTVGTIAVWVRKSTSGGANAIRLTTNNTAAWNTGITQKFTLTAEWQLVVMSGVLTSTGTTLSVIAGGIDAGASGDADCTGNVDIYRAALFQGTYSAQQILDAGGIPLTTSAAAFSTTGKYWGQFDSTDLLTATYPAGYESATIINALTSGVTTTQGVNVVGSYSIGPSVNTAGRIVLKTAPTAEKLAVLQSFMGLLI